LYLILLLKALIVNKGTALIVYVICVFIVGTTKLTHIPRKSAWELVPTGNLELFLEKKLDFYVTGKVDKTSVAKPDPKNRGKS
jgi:hypothetical protein